jgi:CheY-like chemotaxis protein
MSLQSKKVMIVDDDIDMQHLLRVYLAKQFDVVTCSSGEEVLYTLDSTKPDLILMDVDMPGLNGYETCRKIRQNGHKLPIIFVTSYQDIDVHLTAYDAGGDDIVTKPVDSELLLRKVSLAVRQKSETELIAQEAQSMREMAMNFLSSAGENGILLNFVREAVVVKSYEELAQILVKAVVEFGVQCSVAIRHDDGQTTLTSHGEANELELSILSRMSVMGRLVEFKRQFIVNYNLVSLLICCDPMDSAEKISRIRDNAAILAETTEALCENVSMRVQSMARAEQLQIAVIAAGTAVENVRKNHHHMLLDTRILLQELIDKVESTYSWLSTSRAQESAISGNMNESVQKILNLLSTESHFDDEIAKVHEALNIENKSNDNCLF